MSSRAERMLLEHIRPVTDEDREKLPMFSYSRLEQYKNCPMSYKLKYVDEKTTTDTSLALELGSLCHYVLETKGKMLKEDGIVRYSELDEMLNNGVIIEPEHIEWETIEAERNSAMFSPHVKPEKRMLGVSQLQRKYLEEWCKVDKNSGMDYSQKIKLFWKKIVMTEMENDIWTAEYFEHYFEFVFDDRAILHGFVDRIDLMDGFYRCVDYKTSKKTYDDSKLNTSLQFGIYNMAVLLEFGQLPIQSLYRFILLDKSQQALSVGWEKRLIKNLQDLFNCIQYDKDNDLFKPVPSPLCHWCNYCSHNGNAGKYKHECQYYSLWTPEKKTFQVNREWSPEDPLRNRKLIF